MFKNLESHYSIESNYISLLVLLHELTIKSLSLHGVKTTSEEISVEMTGAVALE